MVTLDLASLAVLPEAEKKIVSYIHNALDTFDTVPAHRWINRSWDQSLVCGASQTNHVKHYGYKDGLAGNPAVDPKQFFFGDATLSFYLTAISGAWSVEVTIANLVNSSTRRLFYSSNVVNTLVENEVAIVNVPMVPLFEIDIVITTDAASGLTITTDAMYNGLYFMVGV